MSHYSRLKTKLKDRASLVKALEDLGFKGCVEVHDKAAQLEGYENRLRDERANIILRRRHVGGASNDIGFVLREDGTYEAIISDYDRGNSAANKNALTKQLGIRSYNEKWLSEIGQRYGFQVIKKEADEQGFALSEKYEGEELVITCERDF